MYDSHGADWFGVNFWIDSANGAESVSPMQTATWWRWLRIGRRWKGSCPDEQRHTDNLWVTRARSREANCGPGCGDECTGDRGGPEQCVCVRLDSCPYPCIRSCCRSMWRCQWWPLNWGCCHCQLERKRWRKNILFKLHMNKDITKSRSL